MSPCRIHSGRLILLVLALGTLTGAAPRADAAETIKVKVITILATNKDDKIDPGLEDLARCVKKLHPEWKLTGFRLGKVIQKDVEIGKSGSFVLEGKHKAVVALHQLAEECGSGKKKVVMEVTPPRMGPIECKCCCGKFLPIKTPVRTRDGKVIIIGVCAKPCYAK
jgi:hypothetical protein